MSAHISVGMQIDYPHVSTTSKSISVDLREGTVTAIVGEVATVRYRNGRTADLPVELLTEVKDGKGTDLHAVLHWFTDGRNGRPGPLPPAFLRASRDAKDLMTALAPAASP
jgi:hypothetical protein